jgi:hypothetical protein
MSAQLLPLNDKRQPQKCTGRTSLCRLTGLLHLGQALVLVITRTQQL